MAWLKNIWASAKRISGQAFGSMMRWFNRKRFMLLGVAVTTLLGAYYLLGMAVIHVIDARPEFQAGQKDRVNGGSQTVSLVSALIDREVNQHGWVPNDPWLYPSAALDNMPNYQDGMRATLALFIVELRDQIGRNRGSSAADADLETAVGKINYPGDIWIVSNVVLPRQPSESAYREAMRALRSYNRRVATGEAVFEKRADNLLATLDRLALDMGAASAALDTHVRNHSNDFIDFEGDDIFYNVKGRAYAVYMILNGLEEDFATIIQDRELTNVWLEAKKSLEHLLEIKPWVVVNGEADGQILPNHLLGQGFYLMRARTQLREMTNILLK